MIPVPLREAREAGASQAGSGFDQEGDKPLPRNVERRLLVVRVEADSPMMKAIKTPGGGAMIDLGENIAAYQDDWTAASHTFTLAPDGSAWVSVFFERPYE